jgi:hypothetical protein
VFWAFLLDIGLFYVWQLMLLEGAPARYKLVPFWGLAAYLIAGGAGSSSSGGGTDSSSKA